MGSGVNYTRVIRRPAVETRGETRGSKARPWSSLELARLRTLAAAGIGLEAIAGDLERSTASIRRQAERQRISLRRAGERRGAILGELRHERLPRELREAVFLGVSDPVAAERRVTIRGDLCPSCGRRYAETRTGLCAPCHLRRLAEAHREELAIVAGRRELDAARALKYRARRATR